MEAMLDSSVGDFCCLQGNESVSATAEACWFPSLKYTIGGSARARFLRGVPCVGGSRGMHGILSLRQRAQSSEELLPHATLAE